MSQSNVVVEEVELRLGERILLALKKKVRKVQSKIKTISSDGVTNTDIERRLLKLRLILDENKDDERSAKLVETAEKQHKTFETEAKKLATGTATTPEQRQDLYDKLVEATDTFTSSLDRLREDTEKGLEIAKDDPKLVADLEAIRFALDRGTMTETERAGYEKRLTAVQAAIVNLARAGKDEKPAKLQDAGSAARTLLLDIEKTVEGHAQLSVEPLKRIKLANDKIALSPETPETRQAKIEAANLLRDAQDALTACDHTAATTSLEKAEGLIKGLATVPQPDASKLLEAALALGKFWSQFEKVPAQELKKAQQNSTWEPEEEDRKRAEAAAKSIIERCEKLRQQGLRDIDALKFMLDQPGALAQAAKLLAKMQEGKTRAEDMLKGAIAMQDGESPPSLQPLMVQVDMPLAQMSIELNGLYSSVQKGAKPTDLVQQLKDLSTRWSETKSKALLPEDLLVAEYQREIGALRRAVDERSALVKGGKISATEIEFGTAVAKYREVRETLDKAAEAAMTADAKAAMDQKLTTAPALQRVKAETAISAQAKNPGGTEAAQQLKDLKAVIAEMERLTTLAEGIKSTGETASVQARNRCDKEKLAREGELKLLRDKLTKDKDAKRLKYLDVLTNDLRVAVSPMSSNDVSVLTTVEEDLKAFRTRIAEFTNVVAKTKGAPSFHDNKADAKKLKERLTDKLFRDRKDQVKPLLDSIEKIIADPYLLDPAATAKQIIELKSKVDTAENTAKQQQKARETLVIKLQGLQEKLNALVDDKKTADRAEKYLAALADLEHRIFLLIDSVVTKDNAETADDTLATKYEKEYDDAVEVITGNPKDPKTPSSPKDVQVKQKALQGTQDKAVKTQQEIEKAKRKLEELREVQIAALQAKADRIEDKEVAKSLNVQLKEARSRIKTALGELEDSRDPEEAVRTAEALEVRLKQLVDAPLGNAVRSRNNLPKTEEQWIAAVRKLHEAIDAVPKAVEEACKDETDQQLKAEAIQAAQSLTAKLKPTRDLFVERAFAGTIKRMVTGKPSPSDIAGAKEEGLREVRRIKRLMEKEPMLKMIIGKAYKFDAPDVPASAVTAALFALETQFATSG